VTEPLPRTGSRLPLAVLGAVVAVLVISSVRVYLYFLGPSAGSTLTTYHCVFAPGNSMSLHIVSDESQTPIAGLKVDGELMGACPIGYSCPGPTPCYVAQQVSNLGDWSFTTNSTGFISIPSSELAGYQYAFNLTYGGGRFFFRAMICSQGTANVKLNLPSGSFVDTSTGHGSNLNLFDHNGTQAVQNCGFGSISGNATRS